MSGVPYTFGTATTSIPLSNLDSNFVTPVTIGNASVALGNTISTIGNLTLNNVTINSGTINASVTESYSLANAVVYSNSTNLGVTSANLSFNGTTLTVTNDASISGLTVGKGGGSQASNTALGASALANNSTGTENLAVGQNSMANGVVTGNQNTALGVAVMYPNTSGAFNLGAGFAALRLNTTGSNNVGLGFQTLYSNTTASNNTAVGYQAGYSNTTGTQNVYIGVGSGYASTTGSYNYGAGFLALNSSTTGTNNSASGYEALVANTTGSYNTANGCLALASNTTASYNVAVGYQAGYSITTGNYNTFLGYGAGYLGTALVTGANSTYIGYNAQASSSSATGEMVFSAGGIVGKGNNTTVIGNPCYQGNNSAAWSITSDQRLKKNIVDNTTGLSAITAIQVRNFEYRTADEVTELEPTSAIDIKGVQLGAIAQEIQAILPDCVKTESTGVMSVDTTNLTWYLINAVKELKAEIDLLKAK